MLIKTCNGLSLGYNWEDKEKLVTVSHLLWSFVKIVNKTSSRSRALGMTCMAKCDRKSVPEYYTKSPAAEECSQPEKSWRTWILFLWFMKVEWEAELYQYDVSVISLISTGTKHDCCKPIIYSGWEPLAPLPRHATWTPSNIFHSTDLRCLS